mgnify:CR=1 FL=1
MALGSGGRASFPEVLREELVTIRGCEKMTGMSFAGLPSVLTSGSLMVLPVSEYDRPRRVNRENVSNFVVNSARGPERLIVPPTVL